MGLKKRSTLTSPVRPGGVADPRETGKRNFSFSRRVPSALPAARAGTLRTRDRAAQVECEGEGNRTREDGGPPMSLLMSCTPSHPGLPPKRDVDLLTQTHTHTHAHVQTSECEVNRIF